MGTNNLRRRGSGKGLICGVGINDVDAPTWWIENGKRVYCPIYRCWNRMLERGHSIREKTRHPNYQEVTVDPVWHRLSKFTEWLDTQPQANWRELSLDKDLLVKGNKVYGPDTCCFLTHAENNVFRSQTSSKLGSVTKDNRSYVRKNPWVSRLIGGSAYKSRTGKTCCVGHFSTKEEAEFVAMRESLPIVIEIANANPHQFIRDAMFRWIDDWKANLLLLESAFRKTGETNGTKSLQDYLC